MVHVQGVECILGTLGTVYCYNSLKGMVRVPKPQKVGGPDLNETTLHRLTATLWVVC